MSGLWSVFRWRQVCAVVAMTAVMLGAAGAAAVAQLLVLVGLVGAETGVVALSSRFVAKGWILSDDL